MYAQENTIKFGDVVLCESKGFLKDTAISVEVNKAHGGYNFSSS